MHWKTIAMACLGLAALSVNAQVHRCKDATGKTFYSDRTCEAGQTGQMIERPRTHGEIMQERQMAAEANERKYERRYADQGLQPPPVPAPQVAAPANPPVHPYLCRKAKEEMELAMSLRTLTPAQKRMRLDEERVKVAAACGTP